jgi:acyl-CoA thioesterase FadM
VLAAEIRANGKRAAQARQTGVFVSTSTFRPAPMPAALQTAWDAVQPSAPPPPA